MHVHNVSDHAVQSSFNLISKGTDFERGNWMRSRSEKKKKKLHEDF